MTEQLPFFVYGTLLPDQPNFYYWGDHIAALETAVFANGRLYDLGSYPMLVEGQGQAVTGASITVDPNHYQSILTRIDRLEDYDPQQPAQSSYVRVQRDVQLENGRKQTAWVYIGQYKFLPSVPVIKNGDWAAYIAHKQVEINEWWRSAAKLHKMPD